MLPSNTYEWSSFWFNYLTFWTGNTFYRVWRKKVDSKCGPSHLWPVTNFLSPKVLLQYSRKYTNIYTHTYSFFSFLHGQAAFDILFYILICLPCQCLGIPSVSAHERRASSFFTAVQYPIVWLCQNLLNWFPGVGWGPFSFCFPSVAFKNIINNVAVNNTIHTSFCSHRSISIRQIPSPWNSWVTGDAHL